MTVIWRGPLREDDRASQISEIEGFITRGVSGIAIAPLDEAALALPVADAQRQNIPVVVFDSGLKNADFVSFVATDNRQGGRMAGEHIAKRLNGKGKALLLRYAEGHDSTTQREEGFLEALGQSQGHRDRQLEPVSRRRRRGRGQARRSDPQQLSHSRRRPRHRRHLLRQRVDDVRADARAAGSQLGGQGEVRRLRRLGQPDQGAAPMATSMR